METFVRILFDPMTVVAIIVASLTGFLWFSFRLAKRDSEQAAVLREAIKIRLPETPAEEFERLSELSLNEIDLDYLREESRKAGYTITILDTGGSHGTSPEDKRSGLGGSERADES